ncbi:MAG: toxin-antitoxin system YwqK family antitoxin [Bacteroidia bacterium]
MLFCFVQIKAQYISYQIHDNDTINAIDKDSLKQGVWREFWNNGDLKSETSYKNNLKHGLEIIWYDKPDCVESEAYYKDGKLDGQSIHYSKKCRKDFVENFKKGIKEGVETEYYSNGVTKAEGNFKKGNLDGYYKVYDRRGNFSFESRSTETTADLKPDFSDTANNIAVRVFRRNKWNKKLIVADLTGSMYPFAQQISTWLKLHFLRDSLRQNFVFFNDGDNKRDDQKKIGVTGGVYYCTAKTMDQLVNAMNLTIRNGTGGDAPENVVEAILYGLKKNKNIDNVVLLADNWAKVRDLSLITRVKVPVHVLLCGVYDGMEINPDYLNIAYKTKGSIHTIEQDITDLMMQTSGKKFNINGVDYIIKNGTIRTY